MAATVISHITSPVSSERHLKALETTIIIWLRKGVRRTGLFRILIIDQPASD